MIDDFEPDYEGLRIQDYDSGELNLEDAKEIRPEGAFTLDLEYNGAWMAHVYGDRNFSRDNLAGLETKGKRSWLTAQNNEIFTQPGEEYTLAVNSGRLELLNEDGYEATLRAIDAEDGVVAHFWEESSGQERERGTLKLVPGSKTDLDMRERLPWPNNVF